MRDSKLRFLQAETTATSAEASLAAAASENAGLSAANIESSRQVEALQQSVQVTDARVAELNTQVLVWQLGRSAAHMATI